LTHRSFAHSQRRRDVFLFPPLLPQLPGSQASTFFPIVWFVFFLHSSILAGLATYATVYNELPLCDLKATEADAETRQLVEDYAVWFAIR